jgi:hypothetical protein
MKEELQKPQIEDDADVNAYSSSGEGCGNSVCGLEW